jgi:oxygen-independent coproporphyrinogen-3 oxidase
MAGIYIHIPFCFTRCHYCDFFKTTNISFKNEFLKVLNEEIADSNFNISNERIETIYFGGGTPSVLQPKEVKQILSQLFKSGVKRDDVSELTFELNPDDASLEYLQELINLGINRLSIGIQSFDEALLKTLNRRHSAKQAEEVVRLSRQAGFKNISIDLMYGLPGLSKQNWLNTIDKAIGMDVEHVSAYHLTYEAGTVFYKKLKSGLLSETAESESLWQFKVLREKLQEAGFEHYEVSNFAKPSYHSRHNSNYWDGEIYFGFGPSAHSFDGQQRWWNVSNLSKYLLGNLPEYEKLSETDRYNEFVMLKLRTRKGVEEATFVASFSETYIHYFLQVIEKHIHQNNVMKTNGYYRITNNGWFICDSIIADLFYDDE